MNALLTIFRQTIEGDTVYTLLETLLSWFIRLVLQDEAAVVLRKLCSSLVSFFLRFSSVWVHCIRHLICSLHIGHVVALSTLKMNDSIELAVRQLSGAGLTAALWFSSSLADEVARVDQKSAQR